MSAAASGPSGHASGTASADRPLLSIADLAVDFGTVGGPVHAVREVSLDIAPGEVVALVGESGSGKSVTALTLLGLTRGPRTTVRGSATFDGLDLLVAGDRELRDIRGKRIAMVFQDPMSSLNPVLRVGVQIAEQIRAHEPVSKGEALRRAIDALREVGIPEPADRANRFPHEFSGGMRQRVMIAMALSCRPELLLADEPTTALDVTVQAQILDLLMRLRDERGMAVLLVTHDLGVVAETADRVAVMYGGRIVEEAPVEPFFADPRHPYSWGLLGSIPPMAGARPERLPTIAGTPPSPSALPDGCAFRTRCPHAFENCAALPPLVDHDPAHADRCWLPLERKQALRDLGDGRIGLAA
ncbi:MAG: ABC transporter ATP-binding protein [Solirubrobacteraceae bacterium]|nr:ABC transporter ATP-binding protein [Patulibacter sp.]